VALPNTTQYPSRRNPDSVSRFQFSSDSRAAHPVTRHRTDRTRVDSSGNEAPSRRTTPRFPSTAPRGSSLTVPHRPRFLVDATPTRVRPHRISRPTTRPRSSGTNSASTAHHQFDSTRISQPHRDGRRRHDDDPFGWWFIAFSPDPKPRPSTTTRARTQPALARAPSSSTVRQPRVLDADRAENGSRGPSPEDPWSRARVGPSRRALSRGPTRPSGRFLLQ
jgi:hypothetical protein